MEHGHSSCSGVILAGGLSTRFSGENKAFLDIGGRRIIDVLYEIFASLFHEVIIVTNNPMDYLDFNAEIVTDIFPVRSSLTGIHTGLFYAGNPFIFVSACDAPFIQKALVEDVLNKIEPNISVVIPETASGMEPLFAVYSKNCLPVMEQQIKDNKLKIQRMFHRFKVKKITESVLREKDPELVSFFNINTAEDWKRANAIAQRF